MQRAETRGGDRMEWKRGQALPGVKTILGMPLSWCLGKLSRVYKQWNESGFYVERILEFKAGTFTGKVRADDLRLVQLLGG